MEQIQQLQILTMGKSRLCRIDGNKLRFQDIEILGLESSEWLSYFETHGIDIEIACRYCRQIQYTCRCMSANALVFPNRSGGYTVHGRYHKGLMEPDDISLFYQKDRPLSVCLFVGFMDFLAYKTLVKQSRLTAFALKCDYVILHTHENIPKAALALKGYKHIAYYLPQSDSWHSQIANLTSMFADQIVDMSASYIGYRSLQDYLLSRSR